jgi:hypothetical protein
MRSCFHAKAGVEKIDARRRLNGSDGTRTSGLPRDSITMDFVRRDATRRTAGQVCLGVEPEFGFVALEERQLADGLALAPGPGSA